MMTTSVIDYLGKYEGGVVTSIGIMFEDNYYDAIFYYTETQMLINTDDKLKDIIGDIEQHEYYYTLMEDLINKVEPYSVIYDTLDEYQIVDV